MRDPLPRRFNKTVTVESMTDQKNTTTGEFTQTPATFCTRRASVEPLSGRELLQARAVEADVTHRITMYWDTRTAKVTTKMRMRMGTRYFNITAIRNIEERNRILEFMCREQV